MLLYCKIVQELNPLTVSLHNVMEKSIFSHGFVDSKIPNQGQFPDAYSSQTKHYKERHQGLFTGVWKFGDLLERH